LDASRKKTDGAAQSQQDSTGERRRLSRIRHDDRGNAYVEWVDAPADLIARPKLEVQHDCGELQLETEHGAGDPYANKGGAARKGGNNTTRTDLRKLSDWIKMMRELEERKRNSGGGGGGGGGSEE